MGHGLWHFYRVENPEHPLPRALEANMPAAAPTRSTMKLILSVGPVVLPLDVFSSTEESATRRSTYVNDAGTLHKAGMVPYDTITGAITSRDQLVMCVETIEGDLVEVNDAEMQALLASENGTCTFIGFIPQESFDYSVESLYQVRPQKAKGKVNPYEKPFMLVMAAMEASKSIALLSFVARGKTKYAAMGPDGSFVTLRFDEEVREDRPWPAATVSPEELTLGVTLLEKLTLDAPPVFHDEDSTKIADYALAKAKATAAGETVEIQTHVDTVAPADDLLALLTKSIAEMGDKK